MPSSESSYFPSKLGNFSSLHTLLKLTGLKGRGPRQVGGQGRFLLKLEKGGSAGGDRGAYFTGAETPNKRKFVTGLKCNYPFSLGDGPNTVSESTVSNTELSEFFCPQRAPGRELSEFLSADYSCDKANSPSFFAELTEFAPKTQ